MMMLWNRTLNNYAVALKKSKDPEDKVVLSNIGMLDEDLVKKMISLYLGRCKFRHSLAWTQLS